MFVVYFSKTNRKTKNMILITWSGAVSPKGHEEISYSYFSNILEVINIEVSFNIQFRRNISLSGPIRSEEGLILLLFMIILPNFQSLIKFLMKVWNIFSYISFIVYLKLLIFKLYSVAMFLGEIFYYCSKL